MPTADQPAPGLEVTDMNDNKLTIHIKGKGDVSPPASTFSESSDDIEIVFTEARPKLHGILKQRSRTMSESSDEPLSASYGRENGLVYSRENSLSAYGSESAISECDEFENGPKKTVSFNDHVDRTMYKSGATVSALHSTLRNKKKRQKKREQRIVGQEQRRRRRTSGSMSDSVSDQEEANSSAPEELEAGENEDEIMGDVMVEQKAADPIIHESSSQSNLETETKPNTHKGKKNKNKKNKKSKDKRSVIAKSAHQPRETSNSAPSNEEGVLTDESGSASGSEQLATSDSDMHSPRAEHDGGADGELAPVVSASKKPAVVLVPNTEADSDDEDLAVSGPKDGGQGSQPPSEKPPTGNIPSEKPFSEKLLTEDLPSEKPFSEKPPTDNTPSEKPFSEKLHTEDTPSQEALCEKPPVSDNPDLTQDLDERTKPVDDAEPAPPSKPDTMLSWEDGPKPPQEFQTKCAFEFQNSMIYELDED